MRCVAARIVLALAVSACAPVALRTDDPRRAVALAPYQRGVGPAGAISIREGEVFYPAVVDGRDGWCSTVPVFFQPGEGRRLCLFDPQGGREAEGWFKSAYVLGTLSSVRLEIDVPYRVRETAPLPPRR
jgi:hypothetical protein